MEFLDHFDHVFTSEMNFSELPVKNITEMIFKKLNQRVEDDFVIISHYENEITNFFKTVKTYRF